MLTIASWLKSLGLEHYVEAFEAAEIDIDIVPSLTEEDLKELGLPIGPRRKILATRDQAVEKPHLEPSAAELTPTVTSAPERRQLTVMFVDLVGSTNMSVRYDPEVLSELLVSYKNIVSGEIAQSDGLVAKYLGDGVLAYFGWPKAREDAAEFSIRCAFRIADRIKPLRTQDDDAIMCRIGIATGLVVVGGEAGSGNAREDIVAGEALNLAARLQALAEPGEVIIGDATHRLVGQLFECEDRGLHEVKGFDTPLRVWRALRPAATISRFAAVRGMRARFVGRDEELALLVGRWKKAHNGEGRAVLIRGEAGIGKSRLCEELSSRIAEQPHHFIAWQGSAFHQTNALYPVIDYLNNAAEIGDSDSPATRLEKLARLLTDAGPPSDDHLALFAELLSIGPGAGYDVPEMAAAQKRAATIAALVEWIDCLSEKKALFLLVEDGHWIDATTLDLMSSLTGRITNQSILTVITGRPEFNPLWLSRPQVSTIGLDRLSKPDGELLVREIATRLAAHAAQIGDIVSKGDGNPLFLEELSLAMLDVRRPGEQAVPDSLQGSLMSRLDMLGDAKEAAQICSVLGRRFARPLLVRVSPFSPEVIDEKLATLVANDILHPLGRTGDGRYEFKHALVRDAAYNSLLLSTRRRFHENCGRQLEEGFPEVARNEPELIGHHFAQAGMPAEACRYFEQAGDRAVSSSAFVEAISSYREAVDQLALEPPGLERERSHCTLLLKLGPALSVIDGPQAPSVGAVYAQADTISTAVGDQDTRFKAVWGRWFHANIARKFDEAESRAQDLVNLAERSGDGCHQLEAFHCRWSSALFRGDYGLAIADAKLGTTTYRRELHHGLAPTFGGHDPGVCAYGVCANAHAFLGRFEEGLEYVRGGLALAEQLDHPHSLAHGLMVCSTATIAARDHLTTRTYAQRLHEIGARYHFPPQQLTAEFFLGWADAEEGDLASGLAKMKSILPGVADLGPMPLLYAGLLAEQLVRADLPEEALAVANLPLQNHMLTRKGLYLSEVYRARGEALAALSLKAEAVADLDLAHAIANQQGSALFRMRALTSQMELGIGSRPLDEIAAELRSLLGEQATPEKWKDFRQAAAACA